MLHTQLLKKDTALQTIREDRDLKKVQLEAAKKQVAELCDVAFSPREFTVEEAIGRFMEDDLEDFYEDITASATSAAMDTLKQLAVKGYDLSAILKGSSTYADLDLLNDSGALPSGVPPSAPAPVVAVSSLQQLITPLSAISEGGEEEQEGLAKDKEEGEPAAIPEKESGEGENTGTDAA